jgi:hypothetical protein
MMHAPLYYNRCCAARFEVTGPHRRGSPQPQWPDAKASTEGRGEGTFYLQNLTRRHLPAITFF